MALGIIEPRTERKLPGTELLLDTDQTEHSQEQGRLKHGKGKVSLEPPQKKHIDSAIVANSRSWTLENRNHPHTATFQ